jgi:hypothetical protein
MASTITEGEYYEQRRAEVERDIELTQARDAMLDQQMALSDPAQPEYYAAYQEIHGTEAPDWETYSAVQRQASREAGFS